ncbi:MAG: hypothetical protein M3160_07245 [Candidatus Eremiobacteraeota bacterium]|nr:hypothetical protein [Candidatus Eremiobacteraeota bacterium]
MWILSFVIAGVVVLLVATLAIIILAAATTIKKQAVRALTAGGKIREQTMPLWQLENTNNVAVQLAEAARSIESHATALAGALERNGQEVRL